MKKSISLGSCLLALILGYLPTTAFADIPKYDLPTAGSLLSELEPERHITPKPEKPVVDVKIAEKTAKLPAMEIQVDKINFVSDDFDVNQELQQFSHGKLGKKMNFDQLQEIAVDASIYLRSKGYMTAICYLPPQEIVNNTVTIKVLIGRYADVEINNKSKMTDGRVLGYTYPIRPGQLIEGNPLDKTLLILNDIPGIKARATLQPGQKTGTAKIVLDVQCLEEQGSYAYVDNYGSKSTGEYRYGASYHYNNLSHVGDQFQINYLQSNEDMQNYSLQYKIPVGRDGAAARIAYSKMNYELGSTYKQYDAEGWANTFEVGLTVPMERTLNKSSFYDIAYRNRKLTDKMFNGGYDTRKHSDVIDLGINGYERNDKTSTSYSLAHSLGEMSMDNAFAQTGDFYSTDGFFQKTYANFYHIRRLDDRFSLHFSLSGQYAWNNLDSSEKFYIGGPDGVRAFTTGESGGDSGILGTLELRYQTGKPELQLTAFVDSGHAIYNKDTLPAAGENSRSLSGAGLGMIWNSSRDLYAKLDYAVPLGSDYARAEGKNVNGTLWFRLVKQF